MLDVPIRDKEVPHEHWPEGAWPGTSNVNWSAAGLTVASTTVTRCGPGATFLVQSNVAVDVLFDVIGYFQ